MVALEVRGRALVGATALASALTIVACGTSSSRTEHSKSQKASEQAKTGSTAKARAAPKAPAHSDPPASGLTQRLTPGRTIRKEGLGAIQTPPRPTLHQTTPGRGCSRQGGQKQIVRPPIPGFRATRVDARHVVVLYEFASMPRQCRPTILVVGVDVNGDATGPYDQQSPVRGATGKVSITLPRAWRRADVALVSAQDAHRVSNPTTSVLIK